MSPLALRASVVNTRRRKFAPLCPDFVLELKSPSDDLPPLQAKLQEYIDNGAQLGWLIDAERQQVYVYRPGQPVQVSDRPGHALWQPRPSQLCDGFYADPR